MNQQEQEINLLIDKSIESETEIMHLRILLNKLLSERDYTLEGVLENEYTGKETK